jgi:hypothetical protein
MGRPAISQWIRQQLLLDRPWVGQASCGQHQHLPWHSDNTPDWPDIRDMADICTQCPVIEHCARYALASDSGGFFAGHWLPWPSNSRDIRDVRAYIRRQLKRTAGIDNLRELNRV